jgi:hypothetical protein
LKAWPIAFKLRSRTLQRNFASSLGRDKYQAPTARQFIAMQQVSKGEAAVITHQFQ